MRIVPATLIQAFPECNGDGALGRFDVDHDVSDLGIGLQKLAGDVDVFLGEDRVDLRQHTGLITMDVQQTVLAGVGGQRHFRKVDGAQRRSVVAVFEKFAGHLQADVVLRFLGAAPDGRGE